MDAPKVHDVGRNPTNAMLDPLSLATKPTVIFKFASALLSLVIYSCISSAWYDRRCLFNGHNGICRFGSLALISFIACFTLLTLEIMFDRISSLKVRRRIAIGDVIISGTSTVFYLLLFVFLSIAWIKSNYPPFGQSINCCRIAILLSFLVIFTQAACTGLAYVRYQSGVGNIEFMTEEKLVQEQAEYYGGYGEYQAQKQEVYDEDTLDPSRFSAGNYISYGEDINH